MEKYVIIAAGGKGLRMKSETAKQFMLLNNKPILLHSIYQFLNFDSRIKIILALPKDHFGLWDTISKKYNLPELFKTVQGGAERFFSVKNALKYIPDNSLVAIHDAVRPMVSKKTISDCFNCAEKNGTAVPVIELKDSIRRVKNEQSETVPREDYRIVQTPQVFNSGLLREAYEQEYKSFFTDDASVVENTGKKIFLTKGSNKNIKITEKSDLIFAEILMDE